MEFVALGSPFRFATTFEMVYVGLERIRLELEEIVKLFTHEEIYRRRGVKI